MLSPERHRAILLLVAERGRLTFREAQARFGVSSATIRRDAEELASLGKVQRTRGGLLPSNFFLPEPLYAKKAEKAAGAKARLARVVAGLIPEAGTIFIDAGTTCLEVGLAVLERPDLRIFTNSVPLLARATEARASLNGIGGQVRKLSLAMTGGLALSWLENLRFDMTVVGSSGLDAVDGAFTTELGEAAVKTEALKRGRSRLLVADAGKWGRPPTVRFAPWSAFHHFVTDRSPSRTDCATLHAAGVKLHLPSTS